jgi:soluble lytic murein transglycosylase
MLFQVLLLVLVVPSFGSWNKIKEYSEAGDFRCVSEIRDLEARFSPVQLDELVFLEIQCRKRSSKYSSVLALRSVRRRLSPSWIEGLRKVYFQKQLFEFLVSENEKRLKLDRKVRVSEWEEWAKLTRFLSRKDQAKIFELMGDAWFAGKREGDKLIGINLYERSLSLFGSTLLRQKVKAFKERNIEKEKEYEAGTAGEPLDLSEWEISSDLPPKITSKHAKLMVKNFGSENSKKLKNRIQSLLVKEADRCLKSDVEPSCELEEIIENLEKAPLSFQNEWMDRLFWLGHYSGARKFAQENVERFSQAGIKTKAVWIVALTSFKLGRNKEAIKWFKLLVEDVKSPYHRRAYFFLGLLYEKLENKELAKYNFEAPLVYNFGSKELFPSMLYRSYARYENQLAKQRLTSEFRYSWRGLEALSDHGCLLLDKILVKSEKSKFKTVKGLVPLYAKLELYKKNNYLDGLYLALQDLPGRGRNDSDVSYLVDNDVFGDDYLSAIISVNKVWNDLNGDRSKSLLRMAYPKPFSKSVSKYAKLRGLNEDFVFSIMRQESAFSRYAVSRSDAVGVMQMIEPTAFEVASELGVEDLSFPTSLFNPQRSIEFGTHYLAKMLKKWDGDVLLASASYNAGPHRVERWLNYGKKTVVSKNDFRNLDWAETLPWSETRQYVFSIARSLVIYSLLDQTKVNIYSSYSKSASAHCETK